MSESHIQPFFLKQEGIKKANQSIKLQGALTHIHQSNEDLREVVEAIAINQPSSRIQIVDNEVFDAFSRHRLSKPCTDSVAVFHSSYSDFAGKAEHETTILVSERSFRSSGDLTVGLISGLHAVSDIHKKNKRETT